LQHRSGMRAADELIRAQDPGYPLKDFTDIPIESAALQARDGVQRLYRYNDEFRSRASAVVEQGLIQGWGANKVARALRDTVAIGKSKAETIARTELSSAFNDAAKQRYEEVGIDLVQLIVTPSEALCPYCAARDGNVYRVGELMVPLHPRCRCVLLPFSQSWQKRGLTDDAAVSKERDRILSELEADGKQPNFGPTYWEKQSGLTSAPNPVWRA